jgi:hypothetical protein
MVGFTIDSCSAHLMHIFFRAHAIAEKGERKRARRKTEKEEYGICVCCYLVCTPPPLPYLAEQQYLIYSAFPLRLWKVDRDSILLAFLAIIFVFLFLAESHNTLN